jgi:hypothetical protein
VINPLGTGISDSRPFGSAQGTLFAKYAKAGHSTGVGDASEINSLGHPPSAKRSGCKISVVFEIRKEIRG